MQERYCKYFSQTDGPNRPLQQNKAMIQKQREFTKKAQDFLNILSKVSRGTIQEKLQWIFGLYDLNGDGTISKSELVDITTSIYEMLGKYQGHATQPAVNDNSAKEHAERIFQLIDANKDGVITIEEMITWISRDERYIKSLETLDTVL
ncbi:hypothetical protein D910_12025 [Dendroctonus ponderosae]